MHMAILWPFLAREPKYHLDGVLDRKINHKIEMTYLSVVNNSLRYPCPVLTIITPSCYFN